MLYRIRDYSISACLYDDHGEIQEDHWEDEFEKEHHEKIIKLICEECEWYQLQYRREKDEDKYRFLEDIIWPLAVSVAKIQCAKACLSVDEEKHIGVLSFSRQDIIKTHLDAQTSSLVKLLLEYSDTYFVSVKDGKLQIEFHIDLYEETKIADYSAEIKQLRQLRHQENTRYWSLSEKMQKDYDDVDYE